MAYVATRGGEKAIDQAERLFREQLGPIDLERVPPRSSCRCLSHRPRDGRSLALFRGTGGPRAGADRRRVVGSRAGAARLADDAAAHRHRRTGRAGSAADPPPHLGAPSRTYPGGQILGPTLDYSHRVLATDVLEGTPFVPPSGRTRRKSGPDAPALARRLAAPARPRRPGARTRRR